MALTSTCCVQLRAGSEPKEISKKKKAMQDDEDFSDDEWPSSSDSSSGPILILSRQSLFHR